MRPGSLLVPARTPLVLILQIVLAHLGSRQAAKMEAVGRLAGGVAHDFNNLLTSVIGHADLAMARTRLGSISHEDIIDDLREIRAAGDRAAALTHQLLAFSRKQVLEVRVVDLNAIITGIARMLRRTIGEDIDLVIRLAPDLAPVRADPTQMEQVLLNLAVNARDAMPDGGCLTIATRNVELATGPGVRIRVEDTGVGMSEEVRTHLFEPFYTTKGCREGYRPGSRHRVRHSAAELRRDRGGEPGGRGLGVPDRFAAGQWGARGARAAGHTEFRRWV